MISLTHLLLAWTYKVPLKYSFRQFGIHSECVQWMCTVFYRLCIKRWLIALTSITIVAVINECLLSSRYVCTRIAVGVSITAEVWGRGHSLLISLLDYNQMKWAIPWKLVLKCDMETQSESLPDNSNKKTKTFQILSESCSYKGLLADLDNNIIHLLI